MGGALLMALLPLFYLLLQGPLETIYVFILLVRIFHGVGIAICATAAFTYAADIVPPGRLNEGIGMFGISGLTGLALGPLISEVMIKHFGFGAMFSAAACVAVLGLIVSLPLAETYRHERSFHHDTFSSVLRKRRILLVCGMAFLFGFGLAASSNFLPPFASQRNITIISVYYIAYSGTAVLTRLFGSRIADRVGEYLTIPWSFLLLFTGLVSLVCLNNHVVLGLAGILMGCGHGLLYPALNALAVRREPAHNRGKATGVFTGSIDAGFFIGSAGLGYVADWAGYPLLFTTAGFASLLGYSIFRWQASSVKL